MSSELAEPGTRRTAGMVLRYVAGLVVGFAVLAVLVGKRGDLAAARHQFGHFDAAWAAAAVLAESASVAAYGYLQHRVLRMAGARLPLPGLLALSLANDAISITVPGEPAVSSAYRYRYYRRGGASAAGAGWTIFTILVAQAIGMSLLLLIGVGIALLASTTVRAAGAAALGLVIVVGAGAVLVRRDLLLRLVGWLVRASRRVFGRAGDRLGARIEATLTRMREIPLSTSSAIFVVAMASCVWAGDFLCLLCGFGAVHSPVPWHGVLLAYGAAQVAGSLSFIPGGLGIVEGSLAVVLVGYGAGRVPAVSAALAYRLVSFWLAAAAGWIAVGMLAYQARRGGDSED
jgi:putative heme transporter